MGDLLKVNDCGIYCAAGDFYIDPWRPVARAVVTHAHSDHARWGCESYLTTVEGRGVLARRMGSDAVIETVAEPIVTVLPYSTVSMTASLPMRRASTRWPSTVVRYDSQPHRA